MFFALLLSLLLSFQPHAPLAANRPHLHHFSLPLYDSVNIQGLAAEDGVVYILDGNGLVWRWEDSNLSAIQLDVGQAGHIFFDNGNLSVLSNMRPLDEPRQISRFNSAGQLVETVDLPLNEASQVHFSTPGGEQLAIYPQIFWADALGNDRYLLHTSNGQRWLYKSGTERYRPFPALNFSARAGTLKFHSQAGWTEIPTTGTAVAFRLLGRDHKGTEFYIFTDYYDNDNQRQVVIRVAGNKIAFADITSLISPELNTCLALDKKTGAVYAARLASNQVHVSRLLPRHFRPRYLGFAPGEPAWYNRGTNPEWDEAEAARVVWNQEKHWFDGRSSDYIILPRQQVWETALEYANHQWVVGEENYTDPEGNLAGMLPRWLEHAGPGSTIRGLPYNWGGCLTLEDFDQLLDEDWQAGNILPEGPVRQGTVGVDCSGFVWNCYGYPERPDRGWTPISSPHYWTRIANSQIVWMDRMGRPGHTVLYITRDRYNPDIFYTIESTAAQGNDRVMLWYRRFSGGWYGWRYNGYYRQLSIELAIPREQTLLHSVNRDTEMVVAGTDAAGNPIWQLRTVETLECPHRRRHWLVRRRITPPGE